MNLSFIDAIEYALQGRYIRRAGWPREKALHVVEGEGVLRWQDDRVCPIFDPGNGLTGDDLNAENWYWSHE